MNKIIVVLGLFTSAFTYSMEELMTVCLMEKEQRDLGKYKDSSPLYRSFLKNIETTRKYDPLSIPQVSAPELRFNSGFSGYLDFYPAFDSTENLNFQSILSSESGEKVDQSTFLQPRKVTPIEKYLNESTLYCHKADLKTKKRKWYYELDQIEKSSHFTQKLRKYGKKDQFNY